MHKIVVLADLHLDQWATVARGSHPLRSILAGLPDDYRQAEMIISAGDLAHARPLGWGVAIDEVKAAFSENTPMMFMPGNHDYYEAELDDDFLRSICIEKGVSFAQKSETFIGATRILACTLWSDGLLFGEAHRAEVLRMVQSNLNDYVYIHKPGRPETIGVMDMLNLHEDHLAWLEDRLASRHDGPTMVITHHGPHPEASLPMDAISAGFVSDLTRVIEEHQPEAWVFGHTHRPQSAELGKTRIHNVGLGYPYEAKEHGVERLLLRGCIEVGDEIRFVMDERAPEPVRQISSLSQGLTPL